MSNFITKHRRWRLAVAILSLSLLTVMAGAAMAPALDVIREHFREEPQMLVQLIISMPALFIFLASFFFRSLCKRFRARTLLMMGLTLYIVGGCVAGLFDNIYVVLLFRALVGVGVGIIMPLSTGLIAFYFTRDKQDRLMGYSSAMNMMGGVVATLIAGFLATMSWRLSFLVYLMGLVGVITCAMWLPNERIYNPKEVKQEGGAFRKYYPFIVAMFLMMMSFFIYPADFAIETANKGILPAYLVPIIMALMDVMGFFGGLAFAPLRKALGQATRFAAPMIILVGYVLLEFTSGYCGTLAGSFLVGFANGIGVPFLMSTASMKAGKAAAATVMPLLTMALYLAQFTTPFIIHGLQGLLGTVGISTSSYGIGILISVIFLVWSCTIPVVQTAPRANHPLCQEN